MSSSLSLVVPIHNPGMHLHALLQTILAQRGLDEAVLVDDASSEDVESVVLAHSDSRLRYHRFEKNLGSSVARNWGLDAAGGDYVAMLDADDFYLANDLLLRQRDFLQSHPDHVYVGSSFFKVSKSGDFEVSHALAGTDTLIRWEALFSAPWLPSGCLMRRNIIRFDPLQRGCEDNDFFSALLDTGKGHNFQEMGFGYFLLGGQSHTHHESNFVNLLRTNRANLLKIGIEASFEDILTLRGFMAGVELSPAAASIAAIVFENFKALPQLDPTDVETIKQHLEKFANRESFTK